MSEKTEFKTAHLREHLSVNGYIVTIRDDIFNQVEPRRKTFTVLVCRAYAEIKEYRKTFRSRERAINYLERICIKFIREDIAILKKYNMVF